MKALTHFLAYNNAVPLILSALLVGSGAAFAATDTGQDMLGTALVGKEQHIVSVDNTYLVGKDLTTYSPQVTVTAVNEDTDSYAVSYTLNTIDLDAYVWKDVVKEKVLNVEKAELAHYRDLASYTRFQLKDVVDAEKDRLVRTQEVQRTNVTQLTVATSYTGLIGTVLTESTIVADPYAPTPSSDIPAPTAQQAATVQSTSTPSPVVQTGAITIQLFGNKDAHIAQGASYNDLGALAKDASGNDMAIVISVDGTELTPSQQVSIDTSTPGTHTIVYTATNAAGARSETRSVTVEPSSTMTLTAPTTGALPSSPTLQTVAQ